MEPSLAFSEDLSPKRKRSVSISSVDSEPIKPRGRREGEPEAPQEGQEGSPSLSSADDEDAEVTQRGLADRGASHNAARDAGLVAVDIGDPCIGESVTPVPLNAVSEAPVATLTSASTGKATCVAEMVKDTLPMDVGTRFCLADGCPVGVLVSVLGPVRDPLYLVSRYPPPKADASLGDSGDYGVGTPLHYDLRHQRVIFSLATQCDVARGTDASYVNDEELPENVRPDFSDDEAELRWKREYKMRKAAGREAESVSSSDEEAVPDVEWSKIDMECEEVGVGVAGPSHAEYTGPC